MKINRIGAMKSLRDLKAATWFLSPSSDGQHLGIVGAPNLGGPGLQVVWVELFSFSEEGEPQLHSRVRVTDKTRAPGVLELSGIEIDVPIPISGLHLDPTRESMRALWRPGTLIIHSTTYKLLFEDDDGTFGQVDLVDGELTWDLPGKSMALIPSWSLVQRVGGSVTEFCHVNCTKTRGAET